MEVDIFFYDDNISPVNLMKLVPNAKILEHSPAFTHHVRLYKYFRRVYALLTKSNAVTFGAYYKLYLSKEDLFNLDLYYTYYKRINRNVSLVSFLNINKFMKQEYTVGRMVKAFIYIGIEDKVKHDRHKYLGNFVKKFLVTFC